MAQNGTQGGQAMGKVQKSLMLTEDLYKLVQVVEEKSGASFTRIMTAGLLSYLFGAFQNPVKGAGKGPDPVWMRWAVLLERKEVSVGDLPLAMLNSYVQTYEVLATDPNFAKHLAENVPIELKDVKAMRRGWQADIKEHGGPIEALIEVIESHWVK